MNLRLQRCVAFLLLLGFTLLQTLPSQTQMSRGAGCLICVARCACCMQPASRGDAGSTIPVAAVREAGGSHLALVPVLVALISSPEPPQVGSSSLSVPAPVSAGPPLYKRHCSLLV